MSNLRKNFTPDVGKLWINRAITTAQFAHRGQMYGDKDYFDHHVCGVVNTFKNHHDKKYLRQVAEASGYLEGVPPQFVDEFLESICITVAYLHDVIEDTTVTSTDLLRLFPTYVVEIVVSLTRLPDESLCNYLQRVMGNPIGVELKKADCMFNFTSSAMGAGDSRRFTKYKMVVEVLSSRIDPVAQFGQY